MPPVTLKSKDLILTLSWVQKLLVFIFLFTSVMALLNSYWLALFLPLLWWQYRQNNVIIQQQKSQHIVLNAENQWFVVDDTGHKVTAAQLKEYWRMPAFVAFSLVTETQTYWYMVLRRNFASTAFSRVVVGLHKDENDTK